MVKVHVVVLFAKSYLAIIKGTYVTETNKTFTEYFFKAYILHCSFQNILSNNLKNMH